MRRRLLVPLLALVLTLAAACGDDGPTNGETNQGTGDPDPNGGVTTILNDDEPQTTGSVATPSTEEPDGGSGPTGGGSIIPSDG